ncbi:hypothetical protein IL306_002776 [Fusarium sp. DS 682]|nr:hypothetical protein IL306_002776 [Fusarium sp. DS 682]
MVGAAGTAQSLHDNQKKGEAARAKCGSPGNRSTAADVQSVTDTNTDAEVLLLCSKGLVHEDELDEAERPEDGEASWRKHGE